MDRLAVQRYLVDEKKMYDDVAEALCERHKAVIDEGDNLSATVRQVIYAEKFRLDVDELPLAYFNLDA